MGRRGNGGTGMPIRGVTGTCVVCGVCGCGAVDIHAAAARSAATRYGMGVSRLCARIATGLFARWTLNELDFGARPSPHSASLWTLEGRGTGLFIRRG